MGTKLFSVFEKWEQPKLNASSLFPLAFGWRVGGAS